MLHIIGQNPHEVASKVLIDLYSTGSAMDPELLAEDSAAVLIKRSNGFKNWVTIKDRGFCCTEEYKEFSPYVDPKIIEIEKEYWAAELFKNKRVDEIIGYLRECPLSKRAIILLWREGYRDLSSKCSCSTSIFFRRKGNKLEMHSSVRANNASFLLFLDSSFMLAIQEYVASNLNIEVGDYVHFVDSLHLYKNEEKYIESTYNYLKNK